MITLNNQKNIDRSCCGVVDKPLAFTLVNQGVTGCIPSFSSLLVEPFSCGPISILQGLHRLEKYLNLEGFLEKSSKIKSALQSTGKSFKSLEKSLNSIFCRTVAL